MKKVKIKIITIGHLPLSLNLKQISDWKSEVFEIIGEVDNFDLRCDSDIPGWEFSDELLRVQLPAHPGADFLLAIVNVPIQHNWYARRLQNNRVVFTFSEIREFLALENIPLENAILRVLYSYTLHYRRYGDKIPVLGEEPTPLTHDETRGCLFDMNGIKPDLVQSCNNPIVCRECEERLRKERVSDQTIKTVQKEIRSIRKQLYYRALDFVKAKPVFALVISSVAALLIGVASSLVASLILGSM